MSEIRVSAADDVQRFVGTDQLVWFDQSLSRTPQAHVAHIAPEDRYAADVVGEPTADGLHAGVYGELRMGLAVPGADSPRLVETSGLTWVGVHPDRRRRGVLTAMLRHHFETVHARGVHTSVLHASEPGIYGRHGYGLASTELNVTLGRGCTLTAPYLDDAVAAVDTALLPFAGEGVAKRCHAVERATAAANPGAVSRPLALHERVADETRDELREQEPSRALFATRDGQDVGSVVFRRTHKWEDGRPAGTVEGRLTAVDPAARLALLRRLVDLDLIGSVKLRGVGAEDPLLLWVAGPRGTSAISEHDSLWVRLVDLPGAIEDRAYDTDCDVVVEVSDAAAPWNAGRWRLEVADGAGRALRSDDDPEIRLGVDALGAAYLGGRSVLGMLDAGVVEELRDGACRELARALRTDVPPTAAAGF